jgi:twitching motility protein PilT
MLSEAAVKEARLSDQTDWRISMADPRRSVVFPAHKYVHDLSAAHVQLAQAVADVIATHPQHLMPSASFIVTVHGIRFRVNHIGEKRYALRLIPARVPRLESLGFLKDNVEYLLSDRLRARGGLVLVLGTPGAGKTTTASGLVCSQLARHGGYALCVENPPEYILEGFHGETGGYCEQMDATETGYSEALVTALRCFPTGRPGILMLGEIREKEEASELIQIALDGHLVVTTLHASDTISGLTRLIGLASKGASSEESARAMLAASLRTVVHQRLSNGSAHMNVFDVTEKASAIIMNGALHSLQDELVLQRKNLSRLGHGKLR